MPQYLLHIFNCLSDWFIKNWSFPLRPLIILLANFNWNMHGIKKMAVTSSEPIISPALSAISIE